MSMINCFAAARGREYVERPYSGKYVKPDVNFTPRRRRLRLDVARERFRQLSVRANVISRLEGYRQEIN